MQIRLLVLVVSLISFSWPGSASAAHLFSVSNCIRTILDKFLELREPLDAKLPPQSEEMARARRRLAAISQKREKNELYLTWATELLYGWKRVRSDVVAALKSGKIQTITDRELNNRIQFALAAGDQFCSGNPDSKFIQDCFGNLDLSRERIMRVKRLLTFQSELIFRRWCDETANATQIGVKPRETPWLWAVGANALDSGTAARSEVKQLISEVGNVPSFFQEEIDAFVELLGLDTPANEETNGNMPAVPVAPQLFVDFLSELKLLNTMP